MTFMGMTCATIIRTAPMFSVVSKKCRMATCGVPALVLLWLVCQGFVIAQTGKGAISGIAVGSDGAPVSAVITANRIGPPVASGRAESAANGAFSISGLPDGKYLVCAADK